MGGAPSVPALGKPPTGLAPPIPGTSVANRVRSNSDTGAGGGGGSSAVPAAPQLGGILAGGIPKLRKTGGGIDTGAERESSHLSDPESSRKSAPTPPGPSAPKPPAASRLASLRPGLPFSESSPPQPSNPLVANLRKAPPRPGPELNSELSARPQSSADITSSRARPAPQSSSRPQPPSIASRKPSIAAPPPPPLPPSSTSLVPPARSTLPPPPSNTPSVSNDNLSQTLAMQAARNAFESGPSSPTASPVAPPPPPPPTSSPLPLRQSVSSLVPAAPLAPPPPVSRPHSQTPLKSGLDPSAHTLLNGNSPNHNSSPLRNQRSTNDDSVVKIEDARWRFQDESQLPKPRDFTGFMKRYRAGRGSSVPLDLSQFERRKDSLSN